MVLIELNPGIRICCGWSLCCRCRASVFGYPQQLLCCDRARSCRRDPGDSEGSRPPERRGPPTGLQRSGGRGPRCSKQSGGPARRPSQKRGAGVVRCGQSVRGRAPDQATNRRAAPAGAREGAEATPDLSALRKARPKAKAPGERFSAPFLGGGPWTVFAVYQRLHGTTRGREPLHLH